MVYNMVKNNICNNFVCTYRVLHEDQAKFTQLDPVLGIHMIFEKMRKKMFQKNSETHTSTHTQSSSTHTHTQKKFET